MVNATCARKRDYKKAISGRIKTGGFLERFTQCLCRRVNGIFRRTSGAARLGGNIVRCSPTTRRFHLDRLARLCVSLSIYCGRHDRKGRSRRTLTFLVRERRSINPRSKKFETVSFDRPYRTGVEISRTVHSQPFTNRATQSELWHPSRVHFSVPKVPDWPLLADRLSPHSEATPWRPAAETLEYRSG